jgi:ribosome biogenesis GTPase
MIEDLGFDSWFKERIEAPKTGNYQFARVVSVYKDNYLIRNEISEVFAELTGRFLFQVESPLDYPTVGDWVYVQYFNDDTFAVIEKVFPRKTVLRRKTSGKKIDFQLIAANIDTALIIQSLDFNFNIRRMERYLAMINEGKIQPLVLLSKSDLASKSQVNEKINEIHQLMPDLNVLAFSNLQKAEFGKIHDIFNPAHTYCFLGSSGVGKTTLLNNLIGKELYQTKPISDKTNKGKHATTSRQLHILKNGAMIVDTPGMRELGNISVESGLEQTFDEITQFTDQCRFSDCTHINEDGCAVLNALKKGDISNERYESFLKMSKESAYYNLSYLEKRQRDKKFGKMVKSVMKHKKKK